MSNLDDHGIQRMQDDTHTFLKKEKRGHTISYEDGTTKERLELRCYEGIALQNVYNGHANRTPARS